MSIHLKNHETNLDVDNIFGLCTSEFLEKQCFLANQDFFNMLFIFLKNQELWSYTNPYTYKY